MLKYSIIPLGILRNVSQFFSHKFYPKCVDPINIYRTALGRNARRAGCEVSGRSCCPIQANTDSRRGGLLHFCKCTQNCWPLKEEQLTPISAIFGYATWYRRRMVRPPTCPKWGSVEPPIPAVHWQQNTGCSCSWRQVGDPLIELDWSHISPYWLRATQWRRQG
jgi:hypothetical protein